MERPPPPTLPPKPGSHEASRGGTPIVSQSPHPIPPANFDPSQYRGGSSVPGPEFIPDPGEQWLPKILENKPIQDLAGIAASTALLNALTHSPATAHPSLRASQQALQTALAENIDMASHLAEQESKLAAQRSNAQALLLSTHALERQWRQKQSDMDHALLPFAPASLYQRLSQGVQEQGMVCHALEESFLEGDGDNSFATEREVLDWVRRYRDAKVLYYLRQERKERWDEGRVGGWR